MSSLEQELVAKYGETERARITRGLAQVAKFWRQDETGNAGKGDGDARALASFVRENYAGNAVARDALFSRMEFAFESLDGHLLEIGRDFRRQSDLDLGPIRSFDETLAAYDPGAHVSDDLFANKLAFVILLNFPLTSLDERSARAPKTDEPAPKRVSQIMVAQCDLHAIGARRLASILCQAGFQSARRGNACEWLANPALPPSALAWLKTTPFRGASDTTGSYV